MNRRCHHAAHATSVLRGFLLLAALAGLAHGATETINGSPLNISVDDFSNVTVLRLEVDGSNPATFDKQYYSVYAPFLVMTPPGEDAPGVPAVWSGYSDLNNFTLVSNAISEDGFTTTTVNTVDSGNVTITQSITYVNGTQQYQHTFTVTNTSTSTYANVALRYGGDTYFADVDEAIGYWDSTLGFVYCTDPSVSGLMGMYGGASTPATNYYEDEYANVWDALENASSALPNTVNSTFVDNGMCLEWEEGTLPPQGSFTVVVIEEWTSAGAVQVLPPPSQAIAVGTPVTLQFTVQNLEAVDDTFALSLSATTGLNATVAATVAVPANSATTVQVTVTASSLTGSPETVILTATSQTTPSITNQGTATLTSVIATGTVLVSGPEGTTSFIPNSTMQIPFMVTSNETSPASDAFALTAVASNGFLIGTLTPVTLAMGASTTVNVPVTVLANAPTSGTIQLIATSTTTASITAQASAALTAYPVAVMVPAVQHAGLGATLIIPFTVTNEQGSPGTFTFSVTVAPGMTAITPAPVVIAGGGTATVAVQVTFTSQTPGYPNDVTLTAIEGNYVASATTQLAVTQAVSLPSLPVSPPGQTVYISISPSTPEGVANILAVMAPENANTAQAFAWDATQQAYVQLPAQPSGSLQPWSGVFLATRHQLGLDFSGTPTAAPFTVTLQPGWNFIGMPLLVDNTGTPLTSHAFPADFSLYDQDGLQIGDAATFTDDLGTVGSATLATANPYYYDGSGYTQVATLTVSLGYWIKNNTTATLTLVRNQTGTITTLSRFGANRPTGTLSASGGGGVQSGVLIDRGSPPPPPGSSSASDGGSAHGCGLGAGSVALTVMALLLSARRLRRDSMGGRRT